jgi:hypothetical protein
MVLEVATIFLCCVGGCSSFTCSRNDSTDRYHMLDSLWTRLYVITLLTNCFVVVVSAAVTCSCNEGAGCYRNARSPPSTSSLIVRDSTAIALSCGFTVAVLCFFSIAHLLLQCSITCVGVDYL